MSISYETIINQMIKQLERAKKYKGDDKQRLKHIYHVHGLCELLIDEGKLTTTKSTVVNDEQLMQMIENKTDVSHSSSTKTEESGSLFDF